MSDTPKLATEEQLISVSNTFTELYNHQGKQLKTIESGIIDSIEPSSPAPTKRGQYNVSKPGIFINFKDSNKQAISVTQEEFSSGVAYIIFNGTDCKKTIIPIAANGEVKEGDTRGVSGGEVFSKTDKSFIRNSKLPTSNKAINSILKINGGNLLEGISLLEDKYISTSTGTIQKISNALVTDIVDITHVERYINIYGRTQGEVRWIDKNGSILKSLNEQGEEYPLFEIGKQFDKKIFKPKDAIYVQATLTLNKLDPSFDIKKVYMTYDGNNLDSRIGVEVLPDEVFKTLDIVDVTDKMAINSKSISHLFFKGVNIYTNLYNINNDKTGQYINSNSGIIANTTSIPAKTTEIIHIPSSASGVLIENRNSDSSELRWLNSKGDIIAPITKNGESFTPKFVVGNNGFMYKPEGATSLQMTLQLLEECDNSKMTVTPFDEGNDYKLKIDKDLIDSENKSLNIYKSSNVVRIDMKDFSTSIAIRPNNSNGNSSINIQDLLLYGDVFKLCGDDISPAFINGSYIGGNHGWSYAIKVMSLNHNKTISDIGSVYDADGVNVVLVSIKGDELILLPEDYKKIKSTVFKYFSGGISKTDILSNETSILDNYYSSTKDRFIKIYADGVDITDIDEKNNCDKLLVSESYSVFDLRSMFNRVANKVFTENVDFSKIDNIDILCVFNNTYSFFKNHYMVTSNIYTLKEVKFDFFSILQDGWLKGEHTILIPFTKLAISQGINDSSIPKGGIHTYKESWKYLDYMPNKVVRSNSQGSIVTGYIDNYSQNTTDAIWINDTKKTYPFAYKFLETKNLEAGSTISGTAYRSFNKGDNSYHISIINIGGDTHIHLTLLKDFTGIIYINDSSQLLGCKPKSIKGDIEIYVDIIFNGMIEIKKGQKGNSLDIIL